MINCIDKLERLGSVIPLVNLHYFIASFSIILSNILSLILKKKQDCKYIYNVCRVIPSPVQIQCRYIDSIGPM